MIKFKAWNAGNSKAIAKFHNAEIGYFGHNAFIHELIRGSIDQMQPGTTALLDIIGYSMYVELHLCRLTPGI